MINEADASVDVLRVKPIDQRTRIDRRCELYNVSRAGGCKAGGEEEGWGGGGVRWRRGGWRGVMAAAPGASGVQRQEEEVTVCWAPGPPGRGSGPRPDSQPPSSRQQGDELPQQPLPPPLLQLKVWLSCRLERNKTQSTTTLSPYAQGLGHTCTHTSWDTSASLLAPLSERQNLKVRGRSWLWQIKYG